MDNYNSKLAVTGIMDNYNSYWLQPAAHVVTSYLMCAVYKCLYY